MAPARAPLASLEIWGFEEASYFPMQQQISKSHMMKPLRKLPPGDFPVWGPGGVAGQVAAPFSVWGTRRRAGEGRLSLCPAGQAGENSWPRALWGWVLEPLSGGALARQTQADGLHFPLAVLLISSVVPAFSWGGRTE